MPREQHDHQANATAEAEQAKRRREAADRIAGHYTTEHHRARTEFDDHDLARVPADKITPGMRLTAGYAAAARAREDG